MIYFRIAAAVIELCLIGAMIAVTVQSLGRSGPRLPGKQRRTAGSILIYLTALVFIGSGVSKFFHVPAAVAEMALLGLSGYKYLLVASLEVLGGLMLVFRPLRSLALLFVSAHMGGAICAHLIAGQYFAIVPSSIILSLCWLGMLLRHPQVLWSVRDRTDPVREWNDSAKSREDTRAHA